MGAMKPMRKWRLLIRTPSGLIGIVIVGGFSIIALFPGIFAPYSPLKIFTRFPLAHPGARFLLGTDAIGRDVLSRLIYGTRPSLEVGLVAVLIGGITGTVLGLTAGYMSNILDSVLGRFWDALFALPAVLLGISLAAVLGPSTITIAIAVGIATMPIFARLARASAIREKNKEYVMATIALGGTMKMIVFYHILRNAIGPLLVQAAYSMAIAVIMEAALSFLGLGNQPPAPSWGSMMANGQQYLNQAPLYSLVPGVLVTVLVIGLGLLADGIRHVYDVRELNGTQ